MARLNKNITFTLNKKQLGVRKSVKEPEAMKNWQHVEKTEHHGHYIEDADTGRTVCDLYYMDREPLEHGKFIEHTDAEKHARLIEAAPLMFELLKSSIALFEDAVSTVCHDRCVSDGECDEDYSKINEIKTLLKRFES